MREQLFSTFWHGGELSVLHYACMSSFIERGHRLRIFTYDKFKVPNGAQLEDARRILPKEELFEFNESFSAFSDIFRYKLLLDQGGWWVDTDVYCLKEDIPDCSYAWAPQDSAGLNGAILKFPAGDSTLRSILEDAMKVGRNVKDWEEIGPALLTKRLAGGKFQPHYGTRHAFYPLHWLETHLFWLPHGNERVQSRCSDAPFVHLWASMFRRYGIDIQQPAPDGSFLSWMLERHSLGAPSSAADARIELTTLASIKEFLEIDWVKESWPRLVDTDPASYLA